MSTKPSPKTAVVTFALAVFATGASGAPKLAPPELAGGNCGPLPGSFQREVSAAEKARDGSFAKALAAKKLTPWTGAVNVHARAGKDGRGDDDLPHPVVNTPDVTVIDVGSGEPYSQPVVELVADKRGTVYRVVRAPRGDHKMYTQCGCAPITRGGAAIRLVNYVAELPKGIKYGGTVEIAYTDQVPVARWTNMQNGQPCPAPP